MANVDAVVNTEPNRDYHVDAGHDVDGDIPEVEEPNDVHQGDPDHRHHHEAHLEVGKEHKGDKKNGSNSKSKVSPQFIP